MSVHKLNDYRKKPEPKKQKLPEGPRWFCLNCDVDEFKMYENHEAYCCGCGSRIKNVRVIPT